MEDEVETRVVLARVDERPKGALVYCFVSGRLTRKEDEPGKVLGVVVVVAVEVLIVAAVVEGGSDDEVEEEEEEAG